MKSSIKLAAIAMGLFLAASWPAAAATIAGTLSGPATRYDITVNKVELCQSSTCTNAFVLGSTSKTFDIAGVNAGAEVGNFISLDGIPLYQTWTHVRVTLSTTFVLLADDGTCQTDGNADGIRGGWTAGAASAGSSAVQQVDRPTKP